MPRSDKVKTFVRPTLFLIEKLMLANLYVQLFYEQSHRYDSFGFADMCSTHRSARYPYGIAKAKPVTQVNTPVKALLMITTYS
jgi:hypothetical protein